MWLRGKGQVREVEWGSTHLWDCRFTALNPEDRPPAPFDDWFPAISVSENAYTMVNHQVEFWLSNYSLPSHTSEFTLNVTYADDENTSLLQWVSDWVNKSILGDGAVVKTLAESVRIFDFARLNFQKEPVYTRSYWVLPNGEGNYEGESSGALNQYSLDMVIAGWRYG